MSQFQGLLGVAGIIAVGWLLSTDRRRVNWRIVIAGVAAQLLIALVVLRSGPVIAVFDGLASAVAKVISFADAGAEFIFGRASDPSGPWGFIFAVRVLPVIIFFAALMGVLYHLGVMQRVVAAVAWALRRSLGITGAESLSAAANIFVGQTEAPLTVKPYIAGMTRSQLMAVMVGGFATIAGSVMAAYVGVLGDAYGAISGAAGGADGGRELFAKHLLTASVMSAPAGIVMAKLMLPETETPRPESVRALIADERGTANVIDAAAAGASEGLRLALNVAAMLVAFVALLALIDWPLTALSRVDTQWLPIASWRQQWGVGEFSLRNMLGAALSPAAWSLGVPWHDAHRVGSLLGTQVVATEFVAYLDLAGMIREGAIDRRSAQVATYCLCGFANVASIGIQIGGLAALAPQRRAELAAIAPRAMVAGALACWMTGAVAGLFLTVPGVP
ncbi:MAG: NupC/NupG family nucleoside CNT transporter [Phycisphaerae bacterium]|nr:NupC/NupG family nucleoside CNT transporter [Phycisphaerae bacterium]